MACLWRAWGLAVGLVVGAMAVLLVPPWEGLPPTQGCLVVPQVGQQ